jgi:hypothetical protein
MRANSRASFATSACAGARNYVRVAERHGLIGVCPGTPKNEILVFPEADDTWFRKAEAGPYTFKAHGPRVVENFRFPTPVQNSEPV